MAKNKNIKGSAEAQERLSEKEVWSVLDFATSYYRSAIGAIPGYANVFTPDLINQRLQQVTTNPLKATEELIDGYLSQPQVHQQELIGLQEYFELTDMLTKRTLRYMSGLPAFDYTFYCTNAIKEDYKSKRYKEDYNKVKEFCSNFDIKQEFNAVLNTIVKQETGYYLFRQDGLRYQLQELPRTYCKITGKWDYGFLFDFDMMWFLQPGASIEMYPPVMEQKFIKTFGSGNSLYNPANPLNNRNDSFSFWTQTSPEEGFFAFKFSPFNNSNIPYLAPTFPDVVLRPLIRRLQTNINLVSANKIIIGLIPLLKEVKSGSLKDQLAISPELIGKLLGTLKSGLTDAIKLAGMPFEDVKVLDFKPSDTSMYETYNRNSASTFGVTSRAIYADDRMSEAEVNMNKDIDSFIVTNIYPYFADFLNYQVNKITKKFKFKFTFEGTNFTSNRKERFEQWHRNASVGIVLPQKLAAALGMTPFEFESQIEEASACGFSENLITLMNLNTSKDGVNPAGRPHTDEPADSTGDKF